MNRSALPNFDTSRYADPLISRIPAKLRPYLKDFFAYSANFIPLAANATQTQQIQIQNDSYFIIVAASGVVTDVANTTQITFVPQLVQLKDTGSGREFFDTQVHYHNVYGTAEQPAVWAWPRLLKAGSTFSVQHQDLEGQNRNVRVTFQGFKIFNIPDDAQ